MNRARLVMITAKVWTKSTMNSVQVTQSREYCFVHIFIAAGIVTCKISTNPPSTVNETYSSSVNGINHRYGGLLTRPFFDF